MANEWFFKWHFIGRDGPVEIDSFDGRKICYGGVKFDGTARDIYWQTLVRYLQLKNGEIFDKLEADLKDYPASQVTAAISDTKALMQSFVRGIAHEALEKDRILRGDGMNFPSLDSYRAGPLMQIITEVERRADALTDFYKAKLVPAENLTGLRKLEKFLREYKEMVGLLLVIGGVLGGGLFQLGKWLLSIAVG